MLITILFVGWLAVGECFLKQRSCREELDG